MQGLPAVLLSRVIDPVHEYTLLQSLWAVLVKLPGQLSVQ